MFEGFKKLAIDFAEVDKLSFDEPVFLTVEGIGGVPFEFLIYPKDNADKAVIFGSGAFNSDIMSPPIFNRHKWRDDFGSATTIYYNDPTLYLGKLNLAWGYGDKDRHFLEDIGNILKIILKKLTVSNSNTMFVGSSGGGFTSMILASMFKDSKVFVNNPQTDIRNYYVKHVRQLYEIVYPGEKVSGFSKLEPHRANVVEFFKKQKHVPKIYYAQNLYVKHDTEKHMIPFVSELSTLNENIFKDKVNMHFYRNKEQGHNPISKEETIKIINNMLNDN